MWLRMRSSSLALPSRASTRLDLLAIRTLIWAACMLGGFYVVVLVYHALSIAFFPYDINYGEGYLVNDAIRLVHGQLPWGDVQRFPMVRSPYPPVFLAVDGALTGIT